MDDDGPTSFLTLRRINPRAPVFKQKLHVCTTISTGHQTARQHTMPESSPAPHASRIAIKFGSTPAAAASRSAGTLQKTKPPSTLGKRPRPHALGGESESEDDDGLGKHEAVTSFGAHGAEHKDKSGLGRAGKSATANSQAPLVIGGHKNRDWKAEARSRNTTVTTSPAQSADAPGSAVQDKELPDHEKDIQWGLSVSKKDHAAATTGDSVSLDADVSTKESPNDQVPTDENQDAIDALMGKRRKIGQDIVIPSDKSETLISAPVSEDDSYRRAIEAAAEVSTIDEYDRIPDGEFGAAMLRGMGWKGEERAPKAKEVKRRTQYMGLGAKEDQEIKQAETAKRHGYRERRPRLEEYRSTKDKERQDRGDRHRDSYKSERDRERHRDGYDRRGGDRNRDRDRHRHDEQRSRR
ncbi:DExH-box splicing factor binding site-domain-containing protein [Microdochium trichocladiopsis]|uniref:Pre-mRNA-splicing factor n=1 Tax=Microdochium trichocladiopsis TaxID=1682393 RepID=A0A9P8YL66_9PEZI|nr:DExH-box splicing factor binding site-domain-containing protein [Microdochium trichocladiopsis]KAH7041020.1 DExH-box splicing factor binding site-domain-containing protein [Microdochium trichocladiopsis]